MKTTIYIDGFNLYYGVVRPTNYKWLDLVSLFSSISKKQNQDSEIVKVKFFTAPIRASLSTRGQEAANSQKIYIKAHQNKYPDLFDCVEGFYQISKGLFPKFQKPIDKLDKVSVWRMEEKQTDVNIALSMYRDSLQKGTEQIILVGNDSDLIPALKLIKEDSPAVKIGIVFPKPYKKKAKESKVINRGLESIADWTVNYITDAELEAHQLPEKVPTKRKPLVKPRYW